MEKSDWRSSLLCLGILWTVQILLIAYYLWGVLPVGGMPFDDAWIHFVVARNLIEHGEVSFNPGQWSGGTTSLLWDILLALGYGLSDQMLTTAYVLGGGCYLLAGTALFFLLVTTLGQTAQGRGVALAAALGFALIGFVPYLALSGMDTLLFLALALSSLAAFVRGHYRLTGWLLAAVMITRIEGLGVALLLGLAALVESWRRPRGQLVLQILIPPGLALGLYLLFNWTVTGYLLPTTMAGRKWLVGLPEDWWAFSLERTTVFLSHWERLITHFVLADSGWIPTLLLGGLVTIGLIEALVGGAHRQRTSLGVGLLIAWVLEHNLAYLLLMPTAVARYQAPNLILLPTLAAVGVLALLRVFRRGLHQWAAALAGLAMVACLLPGTIAYRKVFADNVDHINRVHVAAGQWIASHLPSNAVVAAFDIGAISYFGDRWTLDLGGLTDIRFVRQYLYPGRVADYLHEKGATHLAMPEPARPGQTDIGARLGLVQDEAAGRLRLHPLVTFEVPPYIHPPFTSLYYQFYTAYRRITIYEIEQAH